MGRQALGSEAVPLPSRELTAVSEQAAALSGPGWEILGCSQHVHAIEEEEYKRATTLLIH